MSNVKVVQRLIEYTDSKPEIDTRDYINATNFKVRTSIDIKKPETLLRERVMRSCAEKKAKKKKRNLDLLYFPLIFCRYKFFKGTVSPD